MGVPDNEHYITARCGLLARLLALIGVRTDGIKRFHAAFAELRDERGKHFRIPLAADSRLLNNPDARVTGQRCDILWRCNDMRIIQVAHEALNLGMIFLTNDDDCGVAFLELKGALAHRLHDGAGQVNNFVARLFKLRDVALGLAMRADNHAASKRDARDASNLDAPPCYALHDARVVDEVAEYICILASAVQFSREGRGGFECAPHSLAKAHSPRVYDAHTRDCSRAALSCDNTPVVQQASQKALFPSDIAAYLDVAVYVLEARAPLATFHVERELSGARVFLLNKADLADPQETRRWLELFNENGLIALAISSDDSSAFSRLDKLLTRVWEAKHKSRAKQGIQETTIRCVVIGVPNTGKSTIINRMTGTHRARTGNRPGITRGYQWIRIMDGVDLLDTPGILRDYARFKQGRHHLLALGLIPEDEGSLENALRAVMARLSVRGWAKLREFYKLRDVDETEPWVVADAVGRRVLGARMSDALLDDMGYKILGDFRHARFGRITLETAAEYGPKLVDLLRRLDEAKAAKPRGRK